MSSPQKCSYRYPNKKKSNPNRALANTLPPPSFSDSYFLSSVRVREKKVSKKKKAKICNNQIKQQ